jgi:hypothetical protein
VGRDRLSPRLLRLPLLSCAYNTLALALALALALPHLAFFSRSFSSCKALTERIAKEHGTFLTSSGLDLNLSASDDLQLGRRNRPSASNQRW